MDYIVLVCGLLMAAFFDLRFRRIPNWLVVSMAGFGLVWQIASYGMWGGVYSLIGLFLGLLFLYIPFSFGGVGAGDVKLLGAIGALMGWQFVTAGFLYGAAIGGIMALCVLVVRKRTFTTIKILLWNASIGLWGGASSRIALKTMSAGREWGFPYGVAFMLGSFLVILFGTPF